jgi:MFS family permease
MSLSRYLLAVSPIPFIDYQSYEYSLLAGTVFAVCYTLGGLLIALASDAQQRSNQSAQQQLIVVCAGSFVFSLAFAATAATTSFWQLAVTRMIMGFAQSILTPFSCALIKAVFPANQQGIAFGVFNVGVYLAFSLSLSLGVYLFDEYGWKAGYQLFGIIGIFFSAAAGVLAFFFGLRVDQLVADSVSIDTKPMQVYNPLDSSINITGSFAKNETDSASSSQHGLLSSSEDHLIIPSSDNGKRRSYREVLMSVLQQYRAQPIMLALGIATGIRIGGGYVWSAYTAIFYSNLFDASSSGPSSCSYSYNATTSTSSSMCDASYPYCRGDSCYAINPAPWHNQGIDHTVLESYMSWVPLAGSAVGSILGGYLTDQIVSHYSYSNPTSAAALRLAAAGIGTLLATPMVVISFFLAPPACFLAMVGSGLIGEIYLGQSLAVVSSLSSPPVLVTSGTADHLF